MTSYKAKAYTLSIKAAPISGTVTDERNQTLPGVTVRVKNSTQGITTDANGKYTISADPDAILVFSFIGYITQEHPVSNSVVLNVKLLPQANMQNEVVAIGYQTIRKSDVTGSIASVKSSDLNLFAPTLGQALAGKVAGVQV
ncbi:carboxypeptidase-like regulatory domain-containing protein [Arcticibacter svalbardensis]|uniref:carboxypeptidase-like regulatory domain-containing protein n=1 Tax=Arcticibacter svalbardensis TaxID=1288027 RepID=UPI001F15BD8D|nr:carboxypeptidase-like regulatory domain-containing protein [Arcticibacter svalbardensis]